MKKICYYYNDHLHNEDGPAVIFENGHKLWYLWDCLIKEELPNGELINHDKTNVEETEYFIKHYKYGKLHLIEGPAVIYENGDKYWYQYGRLHRDDDKPSIEFSNGEKRWFKNGVIHRGEEKGPAVIFSENEYEYHINGLLHRENGPALIRNHKKSWFREGLLHRDEYEGPAVLYDNGDFEYYYKGKRHRSNNLPALIFSNYKYYYYKGKLHRDNGPAVEEDQNLEWYIHGYRHRENNLPAKIEGKGHFHFYYSGKLHSSRGPAIIITNEYLIANNLDHLKEEPYYIPKFGYKKYCLFGNVLNKHIYYDFIFTIRSKILKFKNKKRNILISDLTSKKFCKDILKLISNFVY